MRMVDSAESLLGRLKRGFPGIPPFDGSKLCLKLRLCDDEHATCKDPVVKYHQSSIGTDGHMPGNPNLH